MNTRFLNPNEEGIDIASKIIQKNGTVAFPTETVYGLGANALSKKAIKKIFKAKGRPQDNPLIVHIATIDSLFKITKKISPKAKKLIDNFWPGPLTIILKKNKKIPSIVTAGLDSVAVRMPKNKVALNLIKKSKRPIAAPSANTSTKPSPTKAKHVIDDLNNKIDAIIKGQDANVGLESTVIDMTTKTPTILRPGKITKEKIEKIIGKVNIKTSSGKEAKSPGMKYKHYSPNAKVIIAPKNKFKEIKIKNKDKKIGIIKKGISKKRFAKKMFSKFRDLDKKGCEIILVEKIKENGLGLAIMNRLKKAASEIILN